ncbi:hypothetical protein B0H17DRAFT_1264986 [Mycena rosella]|uniref:Uncharacterized protein n=1 Tax=Mycena rosella TaxID=1033263 RepID=A0AAD7DT22_MYCRO|nr:hypothetical protein B0H17DRAFT_1264986 [Mycena rosella]
MALHTVADVEYLMATWSPTELPENSLSRIEASGSTAEPPFSVQPDRNFGARTAGTRIGLHRRHRSDPVLVCTSPRPSSSGPDSVINRHYTNCRSYLTCRVPRKFDFKVRLGLFQEQELCLVEEGQRVRQSMHRANQNAHTASQDPKFAFRVSPRRPITTRTSGLGGWSSTRNTSNELRAQPTSSPPGTKNTKLALRERDEQEGWEGWEERIKRAEKERCSLGKNEARRLNPLHTNARVSTSPGPRRSSPAPRAPPGRCRPPRHALHRSPRASECVPRTQIPRSSRPHPPRSTPANDTSTRPVRYQRPALRPPLHPPRPHLLTILVPRAHLRTPTGVRITPPSRPPSNPRTPPHPYPRTPTTPALPASASRPPRRAHPAPQPADATEVVHIPHRHPRTNSSSRAVSSAPRPLRPAPPVRSPAPAHHPQSISAAPCSANPHLYPAPRTLLCTPRCAHAPAFHDATTSSPPSDQSRAVDRRQYSSYAGDLLYPRHTDTASPRIPMRPNDMETSPDARKRVPRPDTQPAHRPNPDAPKTRRGGAGAAHLVTQLPRPASTGTKTMRHTVRSAIGEARAYGHGPRVRSADVQMRMQMRNEARDAWAARELFRGYRGRAGTHHQRRQLAARKRALRTRAGRVRNPIHSDRISGTTGTTPRLMGRCAWAWDGVGTATAGLEGTGRCTVLGRDGYRSRVPVLRPGLVEEARGRGRTYL